MNLSPRPQPNAAEKHRFYESAARRFKAELRLSGAVAAIHIENKNDEIFWGKVLRFACPGKKFRFISASRSYSGMVTAGCTQCLQYKDFLDGRFWIAIDSDYRYLSLEPDIDARHFILQTYTYSFENHFCYWRNAQRALTDATQGAEVDETFFNWRKFLYDYSHIIYPLLVWQLCLQDLDAGAFPKSVFHRLLSVPIGARSIEHNGEPIIQVLKSRTHKMVAHFRRHYPDADLAPYDERCSELGVRRDNAYLFVRGHQLYDMMCAQGRKLRSHALHLSETPQNLREPGFEHNLCAQLCFDEYDEIRKVVGDVHTAMSQARATGTGEVTTRRQTHQGADGTPGGERPGKMRPTPAPDRQDAPTTTDDAPSGDRVQ